MRWKSFSNMVVWVFVATALMLGGVASVAGDKPATSTNALTVLYNFGGRDGDPLYPQYQGIIAQGRDGNMYSTTPYGGTSNYGAVFKITPTGTMTVLHSFAGNDVAVDSGLTLGSDGNFYGTTIYGGSNYGTLFVITPDGVMNIVYDFTGQNDDAYPSAPPIQSDRGQFYGTATGDFYGNGGEVYKMTASGNKVRLFHFTRHYGAAPADPLVQASDGNFYGTTSSGGTSGNCGQYGCGVVFRLTPAGRYTVLHNFQGGVDGFYPVAALIEGNDGAFYGSVPQGGPHEWGVVFKITRAGKFGLLHSFTGGLDGRYPTTALVEATDGNLYGTAEQGGTAKSGVVFKITPKGKFSVVYNFDGATSAYPEVTLLQHTNGKLFGDTFGGGPYEYGTFFSLDLGLGPFVSLVSSAGKVEESIGILGQGFSGTTGVSFNGKSAKFRIKSDTFLMATVPKGATSGLVTVTTPSGPLKSNKKFRVIS